MRRFQSVTSQYPKSRVIQLLAEIGIGMIFFLGGISQEFNNLLIPFSFIYFSLLVLALKLSNKLSFPEGMREYCLFLLVLMISFIWTKNLNNSINATFLYASFLFVWLIFYNLGADGGKLLKIIIYLISIVFTLLFGANLLFNLYPYKELSLFVTEPVFRNHYFIGDFLAVTSGILVYEIMFKGTNRGIAYYFALAISTLVMALSLSRSSYLSLIAGSYYLLLFGSKSKQILNRGLILAVTLISLVFFLATGMFKSVFLSRPYFIQSFYGILRYPFGVGPGNFIEISREFVNIPWQSDYLSDSSHNLFLDIVAGIGVLSVFYVYWLWKVAKEVFDSVTKNNVLYGAIFVILGTNFMLTMSFNIPTMLLIWGASLGVFQSSKKITW